MFQEMGRKDGTRKVTHDAEAAVGDGGDIRALSNDPASGEDAAGRGGDAVANGDGRGPCVTSAFTLAVDVDGGDGAEEGEGGEEVRVHFGQVE